MLSKLCAVNVIPNRIFVGGISDIITEYDLLLAFGAYGNVHSTKVVLDHAGFSKGYGFVTFETEEEAKRLQDQTMCIVMGNRRLNIGPAYRKHQMHQTTPQFVYSHGNVGWTTTTTFQQPPIYKQAPPAVQYQPIYQYYNVPMNMPIVSHQNYYQNMPIPPQTAWQFNGVDNNNWRPF